MRYLLFLSIFLFPVAGMAGTLADLGDLNVSSDRIPRWYPATEAEQGYLAAKGWPEYDATCANAPCKSGKQGFRDAPGNPMSSCNTANPANDGGEDWAAIDCMVDRAPNFSVIYLPPGTYDMGDAKGEVITISRSNVVLRGAGIDATHIRLAHELNGAGIIGAAGCGDSTFPANVNCGAGILSVGTNYERGAVAWTGGFTEETTQITVSNASSFSNPGWIFLGIKNASSDCKMLLPVRPNDTNNMNHALGHIAKIVNINGNRITIDRGLRMDYTIDPGCTNSATARPYKPIRWVGMEKIHFVSAPGVVQDHLKNLPLASLGAGTVESWAVGNKFERAEARIFLFRASARNWLQGNFIEDYGRIDAHYNTTGVVNQSGSVDNVIENNVFRDFVVGIENHQGAEGAVIAYNYMRFGSPPNSPEKSVFNHGLYTREILFEGNDVDGRMMTADHWWGSNGPRITAFRNRVVGSGADSQINVNKDKSGTWIIADQLNWIGNTSSYYLSDSECVSGFPDCMSGYHDFDGDATSASPRVSRMHVEKNMYRNTDTCKGDPTPGRCGFHQDSPRSETSCGTASGPGDCSGGTGNNAGGNNAPSQWLSDRIPHSLYRLSTKPPIWWCKEACSWSDVHTGIGAWGDHFGGKLCKLPAEILAEGGQCTAGDSQTSRPQAPYLL